MSETGPTASCPNCGRIYPADELDARGWCTPCRSVVVAKARVVAIAVGVGLALVVSALVATFVGPSPRFLIGWVVLVAAVYYIAFKLTQRVAFEIIRGRGVPPPASGNAA